MNKYKSAAVGGIVTFIWCILDVVISFIANDFGDGRRVAMIIVLFIVSILGVLFIYLKKPVVSNHNVWNRNSSGNFSWYIYEFRHLVHFP